MTRQVRSRPSGLRGARSRRLTLLFVQILVLACGRSLNGVVDYDSTHDSTGISRIAVAALLSGFPPIQGSSGSRRVCRGAEKPTSGALQKAFCSSNTKSPGRCPIVRGRAARAARWRSASSVSSS